MASVNCSFCDHVNPVDAKFCNECGAGLGLRPCAQCEAINDVSAAYCHQCGAPLATAAATAVTGATRAEGTIAGGSPALIRPLAPDSGATDAAPPPDIGGSKPAPASPRELASAAERLDAFWRDSMQAVEVARAMKGEPTPVASRSVDMLPLRVMDDTAVIDAEPDAPTELRSGARVAIAAALLVVAAGVVYYGYDRASNRSAPAPTSAQLTITAPNAITALPAEPANPMPAAAASTSAAASVPSAPATTAVEATSPVANARESAALPATATSIVATGASIQTSTPTVAATSDPPPAAVDSSASTVRAKDGGEAQPRLSDPARANESATGSTPAARVAIQRAAGDARNRPRNPRAAAPSTRVASPATRRSAAPSIVAPAPIARTPVVPAGEATCSDSMAALGLCRR